MTARRRLDLELVRRGLVSSREQAQSAVAAGQVLVHGAVADKASRLVDRSDPLILAGPPPPFVSRGGLKLEAALDRFAITVTGRRAIDAGASTGGFTDCLLQRGAEGVVAVDVGRGQLHERIARDPRVRSVERTNVRTLTLGQVGGTPFDLIVADLSFISLRTVAPILLGPIAAPGADVVFLIKPQFEAGRQAASVGRGVIRDPAVWSETLLRVLGAAVAEDAAVMGLMVSPVTGAEGNVEFVGHFRAHSLSGAGAGAGAGAGTGGVAAAAEAEEAVTAVVAEATRRHGKGDR
jgi:23S rRNA (cytidine1920-2'-O)/16S rRNA (cytidine1409-2'-O)-methyltransferase